MNQRVKQIFGAIAMTIATTTFTVGCSKAKSISDLASSTQPMSFSNAASTLPSGLKGVKYTYNFGLNNAVPPVSFVVTSGSLPAGLTMSDAGVLAGAITGNVGSYNFTLKATDSSGQLAQGSFSLDVGTPFSLLTTSLVNAVVNSPYTAVLSVSGGLSPYTFAATGFPAGLSLNAATGVITGTPTAVGNSELHLTVTDSTGQDLAAVIPFSVIVSTGSPTIVTTSLPAGVLGSNYATVIAVGGGVTPISLSMTSGTLPTGLTLNSSTGVVSGTPTTSGTYTFTVTAQDALNNTGTQTFVLTIAAAPAPSITNGSLPVGSVGTAYAGVLLASGGATPYSWSITSGALPAGLSLSSSSGVISGTPTTAGSSSVTLKVTDNLGSNTSQSYTLTVTAAPSPSITTGSLPTGMVGLAYSGYLIASGGTNPYTWTVTSGSLPAGLSLSSTTGVVSGTPTAAGSSSFSVKVTDANAAFATQSYTINVTSPPSPTITTGSLGAGQVGVVYSGYLIASGGTNPYTWAITAGTLPTGLSLNTSTGVISGTPTASGSFSFTARVTDTMSATAAQAYSITVATAASPTITTGSLAAGQVASPYLGVVTATGGTNPYTWSISAGSLPTGLTISSTTGVISGTPTSSGSSNFTVKVTDSLSAQTSQSYTLTVAASPTPTIGTSSLAGGQVSMNYADVLVASGGAPPYTWSISAGALPAGVSLTAGTGALTGTPTATGTSSFTVKCTDSLSAFSTLNLSITVTASPYGALTFTTTSLLPVTLGQNSPRAVLVTGGLPPYTFSLASGTLPTGMSLSSTTGTISGVPTATGTSSFTIQVVDARSTIQTQALSLVVSNPLEISTSTLPTNISNQAYSTAITATGGTSPYAFAATGLPTGLAIASSTGILSGTTTVAGTHTVTVTVTDNFGLTASRALSLTVASSLSITTASVARSAVLKAYSQTIATTGGVAPYSFSLASGSTLPDGLTLSSAGVISGTPSKGANAKYKTFAFTVEVTDASGQSANKSFTAGSSLTTTIAPFVQDDISNPLRPGAEGVPYSDSVREWGGYGTLTYSATGLPTGLSINATSGLITGTPAVGTGSATVYTPTFKVADAYGFFHQRTKKLKIASSILSPKFDGGLLTMATNNTNNTTYNGIDMVTADLNGDGRLDLVYLSYNSKNFVVALQNGTGAVGNGTFTTYFSAATAGNPLYALVADMDGDGKLDLVIAEGTTVIEIYKGDGVWTTPASLTKQTITTTAQAQIAIGDINGDGKLDLVSGNGTTTVNVYINCGAPPTATVSYNGNATQACSATSQTIFNMHVPAAQAVTGTPVGVALTDMNKDGKLDLVTSNSATKTVTIFAGNGNGTFAGTAMYTSPTLTLAPGAIRAYSEPPTGWSNSYYTDQSSSTGAAGHVSNVGGFLDMNRDGNKDLLIQASTASYILMGDGNGQISQLYTADISDLGSGMHARASDINEDGYPDIVSEMSSSGRRNIQVFYNPGTGQVGSRRYLTDGYAGAYASFALGKFLGSSTRPDLVTFRSWNSTAIYSQLIVRANNGTTTAFDGGTHYYAYQSPTGVLYDYAIGTVVIGDLNGDGYPDIIGKNTGNAVIYQGSAAGTFTNRTNQIPTGEIGTYNWWNGKQLALVDMDGDGQLDFASANYNATNYSSVGYALGAGDGTFGALNFLGTDGSGCTSGLGAESIAFGDFNRDGILDMAVGQGCATNARIMIYKGNGDGTFDTTSDIISGSGTYVDAMVAYDLNGDGIMDLVGVTRTGALFAYFCNGDGTFQSTPAINYLATGFTNVNSLDVVDLNNDGNADFVIGTYNANNFAIAMGSAGGTASAPSPVTGLATMTFTNGASTRVVDWDGDGKLDILWAKQYGGVQYFKGNGNGTFVTPTVQYSLPNPSQLAQYMLFTTDVNGDGLPDLVTTNGDTNQVTGLGISINKSQ